MTKPQTRDPLGPLDTITGMISGLLLTLLAFTVVFSVLSDDVSFMGVGDDEVCVTTHRISTIESRELDDADRQDYGIARHVDVEPAKTSLCDEKAGVEAHTWGVLTELPSFFVFLGFILLTRRTIRYAQKHGLFSASLADRIERLGWLLLFGLLGAALIEWLAEGQLLSDMLRDADWSSGSLGISVPGVIGAYGLVSIGRVMNRAAALQADADATI